MLAAAVARAEAAAEAAPRRLDDWAARHTAELEAFRDKGAEQAGRAAKKARGDLTVAGGQGFQHTSRPQAEVTCAEVG
ncbi:hypothetical protein [Kribbella sp. VKM Ac-2568]|uniref:hypothetical protein n=1 Tax=Kribbella sp. VKM Ac-2568 TaxID=2512219 RepID=UPI001046621E|nr:hypothetical protein [Kribbella sp. VKM Ac-2568]TCM42507.1 hypothetical protein EV648_11037 [Kribbella sp. VKM Ac-2568]